MTDQTKIQADAAAEAPAKVAKAVAATIETSANETAKAGKRARAATARRAKRSATPTARKPRATKTRTTKATRRTTRTTRTAARKTAAAFTQGAQNMNFNSTNAFPGFEAFTNAAPFQAMFGEVGQRGQDVARRSQQAAQEMADIARSNVEAMVEATRLATEGARSIGQDAVARSREGAEQAADAIRSLAEAKSPTEFVQLQSELARTSFDRMVAESSRLTESMVKLAGKAFQPLSNRATANVERINSIVA
ncbi:MAG: phasin family protein [Sphingomonas sp.]|nr:phasin family protein [Sphingomonas sp.]